MCSFDKLKFVLKLLPYSKSCKILIIFPQINAVASQLAFTCSKLTIEVVEKGVKYVQS